MSGVICAMCGDSQNEPRHPRCDRFGCPGVETILPMKSDFMLHFLGNNCQHVWDGPIMDIGRGQSVTCSKCGTDAFSWSLRNSP